MPTPARRNTGIGCWSTWTLGPSGPRANGGIIPSNVGLDGTIGGACDGKWYGGVYGWGFTVIVPQTGALAHRPYFHRCPYGFGNALLLTGDQRYVDVWRGVIEAVNANAKESDGQRLYPHMHGDDSWYDYTPVPFSVGALEVYYWSMQTADLDRLLIPREGWVGFLEGQNPDYPETALRDDLEAVRERMARVRADTATPDTRMSDDPNGNNPAMVGTLIQLMLGGLPTQHHGHPLHCRVRYFDPARQRAGIPEDVAALVETHDRRRDNAPVGQRQPSGGENGRGAGRRVWRAPDRAGHAGRADGVGGR